MPRLLAVLLSLLTLGCGLTRPADRGRDLAQVLHLGISGSSQPGLYVWALAPLLGTSVGYQPHAAYVGSDYGYTYAWHQAGYGMLAGGELVRAEWGFSVEGFIDRPLWDAYATQTQLMLMNLTVSDQRLGSTAQTIALRRVEVGLHVLFVGVSVGLDLFALGDFLAGWFGWDPSDDDDFVPLHAPFESEAARAPPP
jgi:hypothetical protein